MGQLIYDVMNRWFKSFFIHFMNDILLVRIFTLWPKCLYLLETLNFYASWDLIPTRTIVYGTKKEGNSSFFFIYSPSQLMIVNGESLNEQTKEEESFHYLNQFFCTFIAYFPNAKDFFFFRWKGSFSHDVLLSLFCYETCVTKTQRMRLARKQIRCRTNKDEFNQVRGEIFTQTWLNIYYCV